MPTPVGRPCPFDRPFTRENVVAAGRTPGELRGWLERHEVMRVARGVYVPAHQHQEARVITSLAVAQGRAVVPILGAAHLHGLWLPPGAEPRLQRLDARRHIPDDCLIPRPDGLTVPDLAWTALQVARGCDLAGALVPLDFALRTGVTRARLRVLADGMRGWPGTRLLMRAVECADALSESPLESWSRGLMATAGLPHPVLQQQIDCDGFRMRADFLFVDARVIGEADGMGKYRTDTREAVYQEKRRQSRLQSSGYTLFRWTWDDVHPNHTAWLRGLRAALGA